MYNVIYLKESRCESIGIASILPTCDLPFPTTFAICASQDQSVEISEPRYVYWSTIGYQYVPLLCLNDTGFSPSSLHTTTRTARFLAFAVTLHFLVGSSAFAICFCIPSGVSNIPRSHLQRLIPTPYLPPP